MDNDNLHIKSKKVCAIVPAFNEEGRVSEVVKVLRHLFPYVLVVDDGSTDKTSLDAAMSGAAVLVLPENVGKAHALQIASRYVHHCKYVVLFDADLTGLHPSHVYDLLEPVLRGRADMTIGLLLGGRVATHLAQSLVPHISGQRAMKVDTLRKFFEEYGDVSGYGIEEGLKRFAKEHNLKVEYVKLWGVAQVMKEEKYGLKEGVKMRMGMYRDIVLTLVRSIKRFVKKTVGR
jgi:glycosyltransferase involved in cell wall biosynthesis